MNFKSTKLCGAIAIALVSVAPAAQAQSSVTVYGVAATELIHATNVSDSPGGPAGSTTRLENSKVTASRLGFRGSEDLGSGLSAVFGLESGYSLDTGAQSNANFYFNRGSWVGLKGGFGTLTFGRHWDIEDDILGRYFIFGGYSAFQFSEFGAISDTVANSVKYVSPNWSGFTVRGLYGLGEGSTGRTVELAVNYAAGGPFEAGATVRSQRNLAGRDNRLATVGASYLFAGTGAGDWRLHAGYAKSDPQILNLPKATVYDLGVVWTPSGMPVNISLDYVNRNQQGTPNDSRFVRLGAEYFLSKRTAVIANLIALKNKGTAKERFYGSGAAGLDQNVTSLGLRHTF